MQLKSWRNRSAKRAMYVEVCERDIDWVCMKTRELYKFIIALFY